MVRDYDVYNIVIIGPWLRHCVKDNDVRVGYYSREYVTAKRRYILTLLFNSLLMSVL